MTEEEVLELIAVLQAISADIPSDSDTGDWNGHSRNNAIEELKTVLMKNANKNKSGTDPSI